MRPALLLATLVLAAPAAASIEVATGTQRASLRVAADGTAEVSWTVGGARRTLLVPLRGQVLPGGSLHGADVSKPAAANVPFLVAARRTPDGRLWALQAWHVASGGPVALRLSRWRGAATVVTLEVVGGGRVTGRATFQGRPVHGFSPTPEGKQVRLTVFVDCLGCPGKPGWSRLLGVSPRADGSFSVFLRPAWQGRRYRAVVAGPNGGTTLAPDAAATT